MVIGLPTVSADFAKLQREDVKKLHQPVRVMIKQHLPTSWKRTMASKAACEADAHGHKSLMSWCNV